MESKRCDWAKKPIEIEYHDNEWGKPQHNDQKLFEFLILEGMQAGLSWITILNKRENFRKAFDSFDPLIVAGYDEEKKQELLQDAGIIRNRLKINAAIENAKAFLKIQAEYGSFDQYIWGFVDGSPLVNRWQTKEEVPASTELSDRMSKELKKRGFRFVGTTICYSFMQATGMVNDHLVCCEQYHQCS